MVAQPIADVDGRRSQLARDNLILFVRRMFPAYRVAEHHWRIAEALQAVANGDVRRLAITVPPRHGKSVLASEHFPAWYLGRNPDKSVIAASYAALLAYRFSRRARNLLNDPRWPFAASTAGDLAQVQSWGIEGRRGGYVAAGVGGGIAGLGADLLLIDDPVRNKADAGSETVRDATWNWYNADAYTRLEPDGAVVLIGTRWNEDDLIGRALAQPEEGWVHIDFPALAEAGDALGRQPGEALWPDRFDAERLGRIKTAIGSRDFASLYQQRPSPAEGGILKRHWWRFWHVPGQPLPPVRVDTPGGPVECPCVPLPYAFDEDVQSWDLAFKDNKDNSYVVGQVGSRSGADLFVRDQIRDHLDFPATLAALETLSRQWPTTGAKYVEDKANGPAVIATARGKIAGLIAVDPQGDKTTRAHAASPFFEAGNVYLPHPRIAGWVDGLIEEAASYPNGKATDQVDALTQMVMRTIAQHVGTGGLEDAFGRSAAWQSGGR